MRTKLILCAIIYMYASFCADVSQAAERTKADAESRLVIVRDAAQKIDPSLFAHCVKDFQENMNDPSSFELINSSNVQLKVDVRDALDPASQEYFLKYPERATLHQDGWKDSITLMTPIRGKNGYGGLVRQCLYCYYNYDAGKISYIGSGSLARCLN